MALRAHPSTDGLTPLGPRLVEMKKTGAPYQTWEHRRSQICGGWCRAKHHSRAALGRGLRLGLAEAADAAWGVLRVGEGVRELSRAQTWAPGPVSRVAYVSRISSCICGFAVPIGFLRSAGRGYIKGLVSTELGPGLCRIVIF